MNDGMTDFQLKTMIKMVIAIIKKNNSKEEAIAELQSVIDDKKFSDIQ